MLEDYCYDYGDGEIYCEEEWWQYDMDMYNYDMNQYNEDYRRLFDDIDNLNGISARIQSDNYNKHYVVTYNIGATIEDYQ